MQENTSHDVELLRRVTAGDRDAFAELFDQHASLVLGLLVRMLRRRGLAEEILQDVFLQAWRQAGRYRPERASPRGWLLMLARSRALDSLRAERSRRQREEAAGSELPGGVHQPAVAVEALEAEERRRQVHSLLRALPATQRQCIELAFFGGLTHSEIAERLGQPLGTVKSRILFGMRKMREAAAS